MQEDHLKKLLSLPSEWWRLSAISSKLSGWFSQYIVGLAINAEYSGHYVHRVLSVFLISFDNLLLWFTAGHVIDQLKNDLSSSDVRINRMRWLDRFALKGAESIPISTGIEAFSSKEIGIPQLDFGVIRISGLEEVNLRKNSKVKVFSPQAWYNAENSNPEGFYLLGFPKESLLISDESKEQPAMWINLVAIPIQRIKPECSSEGEFWDDQEAFYGQILSFIDNPSSQINDIDFMSGGPIISIERDPKHGLKYRLFAIQRSWLQKKRIIRAEPFNRIMPVFK